jgi:NTP pyrophosphatase (non-canonical NTP hydrolase)
MKKIDFDKYQQFVDGVTSACSKDFESFIERLQTLSDESNPNKCNIERLLTAGVGINAEGGEFLEIIKKIIFQGKEYTDANREHLIIELGDIMWYVAQACMAMGVSVDDVIARNVEKLSSRYPGGEFDVFYSENRKEGDL